MSKPSQPPTLDMSPVMTSLCLQLPGWAAVPVEDHLEGDDGVDHAAADVGEDDDLVACLLDAGEDPRDGPKAEQEAGHGRQLASVTVLEVCDDLDHFSCG